MRVVRAFAVGVVFALLLSACEGGEDPPAGSPSTTAASSPSDPASPTPTVSLLTGPCCYGLALETGRYQTPSWFEPGFSLDVGEGFFGVAAEPEQVVLIGRGQSQAGNLERYVGFFVAPKADALVRQLRATPLAVPTAVRTTTLDGLAAVTFDARALPNPNGASNDEITPGAIRIPAIDRLIPPFFYTESGEALMRFIVVDFGDFAFLIYVEAPPDRFDAFAVEVDALISSLQFDG